VYENAAWAPERAVLPPAAVAASRSGAVQASEAAPLGGAQPVLSGSGTTRFSGPVPPDQEILVSETANGNWQLDVNGHRAARRVAFGWAMAFGPTPGGRATLGFDTPVSRTLAILVETLLWLAAVVAVIVGFRSRGVGRVSGPDESQLAVPADWLQERDKLMVGPVAGARRRPRVTEPVGVDEDELWR
jgi:hypothetical protein